MSDHPSRDSDAVSPIELFFDLVFVFAISQLYHHLLQHLTWRGAAETTVLLLAVFTPWVRRASQQPCTGRLVGIQRRTSVSNVATHALGPASTTNGAKRWEDARMALGTSRHEEDDGQRQLERRPSTRRAWP